MSDINFCDMKEIFGVCEDDVKKRAQEALKPCPFCGGKGLIENMGYPHWIYCEDCGAHVPCREYGEMNAIIAGIRKWNNRTEYKKCPWVVEAHIRNIIDAAQKRPWIGDNCMDDMAGGKIYSIHFGSLSAHADVLRPEEDEE